MSAQRQLAAILFADIAGYTALMQKDEQTASILLRRFQKEMELRVAEHNGRIVNFYGDGALCTFQIPIDAVRCAMELQTTFGQEPVTPVRMGIHSGTVTYEGDKIYGDSVNLASRIESMGVPGAVLFSKKIRDEIKNQPDIKINSLGEFAFKNVEEEMEVFALANEGFVVPKRGEMKGKLKTQKRKWLLPSIAAALFLLAVAIFQSGFFSEKKYNEGEVSLAVVPFRNISGDDGNSHYGMGMASEIRTKLSLSKKFAYLTSLQTTANYANSDKTPKEIGRELNVDYLLMGMFQIAGDDIRVNIELLDSEDGKNVEEIPPYHNKFTDIFTIQNDVANQVLRQFSFLKQENKPEDITEYVPDVKAYGHYLKGQEFLTTGWDITIWDNAFQQFQIASQIDSNYLSPWVGQLDVLTDLLWFINPEDSLIQQRAASLMEHIENNFPESWEKNYARGIYQYHGLSNYEKGRKFLFKALEENPENSSINTIIAAIYKRGLKHREALFHIAKAKNQSPSDATIWSEIGEISMNQGDYKMALEASKTIVNLGDTEQGRTRLLGLAITLGDIHVIPKNLELDHGSSLIFYENYFEQNWSNCLTILDTTKAWKIYGEITPNFKLFHKAKIFHITGQMDSCQFYAAKLLTFYESHPEISSLDIKAFALSMLGKREKSFALLRSGVDNNGSWVALDEEEILRSAGRLKSEIENYIYLQDYGKATETLLTLNEAYPNYGNLREYSIDPLYDRIKKEHPPFDKAVAELKLPELVPFEGALKG